MKKTASTKIRLRSSKLMNSIFVGNFKAAFHGRGIEFQDFREYTPSDDAKYIDWIASSREGNTVMRRYREEKGADIYCVLDVCASLFFSPEKMELYRDVLELLYYASHSSGQAFGGFVLDTLGEHFVPPKKSKQSFIQLSELSAHPKSPGEKLYLNFLGKKQMRKGIVFVISDSLNIDSKSFKIASLKHDVVYIHISSIFENTLEGKGIHELRGENTTFAIDLDNKKKVFEYQANRKEELKNFRNELLSIGVESIFLDEGKSLLQEFISFMKHREVRR